MDGLPVTIRLLDPPLHEFLPHDGEALESLCEQLVKEYDSKRGQHMNAAKVGGWVGGGPSRWKARPAHECRQVGGPTTLLAAHATACSSQPSPPKTKTLAVDTRPPSLPPPHRRRCRCCASCRG